MPDYQQANYLGANRPLPGFFWSGETKMACVRHAIGQSLEYGYAHHIQRLMVTGNFALLAGIDPDEVDAWYLGIYVDAIEWVELPNTRGMSQFADGGLMGSKPYASSGAYLERMGHYCKGCHYQVKARHGDGVARSTASTGTFVAQSGQTWRQPSPRPALCQLGWPGRRTAARHPRDGGQYLIRLERL